MKATNNTITERVRAELFSMKDEKYADFSLAGAEGLDSQRDTANAAVPCAIRYALRSARL